MPQSDQKSADLVNEHIRRRWSPKVFSSRPIQKEHLRSLFEAARWSVSSMNEQPWNFLVATKKEPEAFIMMVECLDDGNAIWARNAPVLILSVTKRNFNYKNRPNRHAWHDVGMATQNMSIQATALGLCIHSMGGFSTERAVELFNIPAGHEPVAMLAVGYLGDPSRAPNGVEEIDFNSRTRHPVEDFVFTGKWGETSFLIKK